MTRIFATVFLWVVTSLPLQAQYAAPVQSLAQALSMEEIIDVMHQEGIAYGDQLAQDMFPDRAGPMWQEMVRRIYDTNWMYDTVMEGFASALEGTDVTPLIAFFESDLGRRIVTLEISARRAMMDEEIEKFAEEQAAQLMGSDDPRILMLQEFIEVNALLESNVVGALNSNYAFYTGLAAGGAFPEPLSDEEILADVWSQEPTIRENTEKWLYSYLMMAYGPLSDAELQAYIDLSRTREGQALNQALFDGFDPMFKTISHALGLAAAQMMSGEEL